jgi:hypothetical protein
MRKAIITILAACYFVVTCGVVVNLHYCMDRLASFELFGEETDSCGQCGMDMHKNNNCCKDEVQFVKMKDDQVKSVVASFTVPALEALPPVTTEFLLSGLFNIDEQRHYHNHSPPLLSAQDTYLQNNVFRI